MDEDSPLCPTGHRSFGAAAQKGQKNREKSGKVKEKKQKEKVMEGEKIGKVKVSHQPV